MPTHTQKQPNGGSTPEEFSPENGPLKGIKILDLGTMLAGPLAAGVLADQGADVTKVEPVGLGDVMRYLGATRDGASVLFQSVNRGKKSIALDLKKPEGLAVIKQLVASADVLLHNFRGGVPERLGIDYPAMRAINPDLIYLSVSGFGTEGPYAKRAAFDNVIQAFAGVAMSQADLDTGEPIQYYQIFADKLTALNAAQAITAALLARERGRGGQQITLSMADSVASFLWPDVASTDAFVGEGANAGPDLAKGVKLMKFKNGWGQCAPLQDAQFHGWCKAFGVDSSDPKMATIIDRAANMEEMVRITAEIAEKAAEMDVDQGIDALIAEDVPAAKAYRVGELPQHPQMQANNVFAVTHHPTGGEMIEPRNPPRFSKTPSGLGFATGALGAQGDEILSGLGYSQAEIDALRASAVIG